MVIPGGGSVGGKVQAEFRTGLGDCSIGADDSLAQLSRVHWGATEGFWPECRGQNGLSESAACPVLREHRAGC